MDEMPSHGASPGCHSGNQRLFSTSQVDQPLPLRLLFTLVNQNCFLGVPIRYCGPMF
jgi:hypothetical protein